MKNKNKIYNYKLNSMFCCLLGIVLKGEVNINKNLKLNIFYIGLILIFKEVIYLVLDVSIFKNSPFKQALIYSLSIIIVFLLILLFNRKQFDFNRLTSKRIYTAPVLSADNFKITLFSFGLLCLSQSLLDLFMYLLETISAFKFTRPPIEFMSVSIQDIIRVCLVPAIFEELLYRGIIVSSLKKYNTMLSIFLSSFLFGITHSYTGQVLSAFLGGLVYAYLFIKTGSLFPSIILHFLNNFLVIITIYLCSKYPKKIIGICVLSYKLVFSVVALFIYLRSKLKKHIKLNQNLISLKESVIITIFNICMDIYIIWRIGVIFY